MPSPRHEQLSQRRGGFGLAGSLQRADEGVGCARRLALAPQHLRHLRAHDGRVQVHQVGQEHLQVITTQRGFA